jgi:hypothetical protein
MAVTGSLKLEVTSSYKGGTRVWSNRYYFDGTLPPDGTHWAALVTAVTNSLKPAMRSSSTFTQALGYAAGSDVPVYSNPLSIAGTITPGANARGCPLGVAAIIRWSTAARSTKNHPIYLFKYLHDVFYDATVAGNDKLEAGMKSAMQTFATAWVTGFSDGTITHHLVSPTGNAATGSIVEEYLSHRDFPYQTSV